MLSLAVVRLPGLGGGIIRNRLNYGPVDLWRMVDISLVGTVIPAALIEENVM
jgi:hypothetical protein